MWSFQVSMSCRVAFSQLMQDKFGETALITASTYGHIDVAELLLARGAVVNYQRKVRVLYVDGPHGVAQNGVLSLEQLRWGAFCIAMWLVITVYGSLMHGEWSAKFRPT